MIRGVAAAASVDGAADAANAALQSGGSAADALIAGFLVAAGAAANVLLAPTTALVAGSGLGARAFDGRAGQPGLGAARPRGFVEDAEVPRGARVAVPRSIAMLAVLHSYAGRLSLRDLTRAGVEAAQASGAPRRAAILAKIGERGAAAAASREMEHALLAAGGAVAGGTVTVEDLANARPLDDAAKRIAIGDAAVLSPPWQGETNTAMPVGAIVAADARGLVGVLCYAAAEDAIALPDVELGASPVAIPVRRGVRRIAPGTPLAAPAPLAIVIHGPVAVAAAVQDACRELEASSLAELTGGTPIETSLAAMAAAVGAHRALAVVRDGRDARAVRV